MNNAWQGFKQGRWTKEIDVRGFIQANYTPYEGDSSFLAGATENTTKLWDEVLELFKKETGEGFYEFLSNYRVKKAKELLITTNFKIYEVAEKVGYNDSITFGRAFKKITGTTPNNFRNNKIKQ